MPKKTVEVGGVEATEAIGRSITNIAEGMKALRMGALNDRALVLLIADSSGVGRKEIVRVLESLETLGERYLRKAKDLKAEAKAKSKREEDRW